jgi:hypothetical protein
MKKNPSQSGLVFLSKIQVNEGLSNLLRIEGD